MREALALTRAGWLAASSYRLQLVLSLGSLVAVVVPLFYVAGAIQPLVADSIQNEGSHYFTFLLVGIVVTHFLGTAVNVLPGAIGGAISTGTFEVMLSTPVSVPTLLWGYLGYPLLWTAARAAVLVAAGAALGGNFAWDRLPLAFAIVALIVLAYFPIGIMSAAAVIAFRTPTPLGKATILVSTLLGGVYWSTRSIPSWLQDASDFVPLTYGLRALRHSFLDDASLREIAPDLGILVVFALALYLISALSFRAALRYARRMGTLAQY